MFFRDWSWIQSCLMFFINDLGIACTSIVMELVVVTKLGLIANKKKKNI